MTDVDAELFARIRCRDSGAFRDVVARHHARQMRLAALCTVDSQTAEALVRATWISSIAAIEHSLVERSLAVWLARRLLDTTRTSAWAERCSLTASSTTVPGPGPVQGSIHNTIRRLPELDRWVVTLRDVERWSATDIEDCLGLAADEVRAHLHLGRRALVADHATV